MVYLIDPADGAYTAVSLDQYAALPGHVAARYLARLTITAALETSRRVQREKGAKN